MKVRKAERVDYPQLIDLLKENAEWLREKGSDQWSDLLNGVDKHHLDQAVERGDAYLFFCEGQLVGMAAVWLTPSEWDQAFWKVRADDCSAAYIHRICTRPQIKGNGYGSQILDTIKQLFRSQCNELRLDCIKSNQKLCEFYKENEFKQVVANATIGGQAFQLFRYSFVD